MKILLILLLLSPPVFAQQVLYDNNGFMLTYTPANTPEKLFDMPSVITSLESIDYEQQCYDVGGTWRTHPITLVDSDRVIDPLVSKASVRCEGSIDFPEDTIYYYNRARYLADGVMVSFDDNGDPIAYDSQPNIISDTGGIDEWIQVSDATRCKDGSDAYYSCASEWVPSSELELHKLVAACRELSTNGNGEQFCIQKNRDWTDIDLPHEAWYLITCSGEPSANDELSDRLKCSYDDKNNRSDRNTIYTLISTFKNGA